MKLFMTLAILLLLYPTISGTNTYAQEIKIIPESNIIQNETVYVFLEYEGFNEKDYKIRPISDRGIVQIKSIGTTQWINQFELATKLPYLQKEYELKITTPHTKVSVQFEIIDLKTAEIYKTIAMDFYNPNSINSQYAEKLNHNLTLTREEETTPEENLSNEIENDTTTPDSKKNNLLIIVSLFAGIAILLGILYKVRKPSQL